MKVGNVVLAILGVLYAAMLVFLAIDDATNFFQLAAAGIALGSIYALVCLGFVVIYRATGIINFAQVGMVILGAYFTYNASETWGLDFWPAVAVSMAAVALLGVAFERFGLRRMAGKPIFSTILLTIGLYLLLEAIVTTVWVDAPTLLRSPWGSELDKIGDIAILRVDLAAAIAGAVILIAFFMLFRYTKVGLAMRATAIDPEAALAQGISVPRIVALSWAIAGVVAVVAGTMLGAGATPKVGLTVGIGTIALQAFPCMVLGGLDSPGGAVVGGLIIGVSYELALGYNDRYLSALGTGFATALPYLIMLVILLIRPSGLFGTSEVRRV